MKEFRLAAARPASEHASVASAAPTAESPGFALTKEEVQVFALIQKALQRIALTKQEVQVFALTKEEVQCLAKCRGAFFYCISWFH
jgi:hypothetical protein